jgi:hypothetical protein
MVFPAPGTPTSNKAHPEILHDFMRLTTTLKFYNVNGCQTFRCQFKPFDVQMGCNSQGLPANSVDGGEKAFWQGRSIHNSSL